MYFIKQAMYVNYWFTKTWNFQRYSLNKMTYQRERKKQQDGFTSNENKQTVSLSLKFKECYTLFLNYL